MIPYSSSALSGIYKPTRVATTKVGMASKLRRVRAVWTLSRHATNGPIIMLSLRLPAHEFRVESAILDIPESKGA
jgi:hypothetical protein